MQGLERRFESVSVKGIVIAALTVLMNAGTPEYVTLLHGRLYLCRLTTMGKEDRSVRMSLQTLRVLEAFLENPTDQLSGADIHQRCGIASGTLYPILLRLESAGWFVSRWESIDPSTAGRPRRRLYRLTSTGLKRASEVFASFNRGVLT
jgi:DNA-binding MarR family transcriptional regulator